MVPSRAMDLRRSVRSGLVLVVLSAVITLGACGGGGGANYPGKADVAAAQAGWCKELAKRSGAGDAWEHMSDCKSASSSASGAYLRKMTQCIGARLEALGDAAPDLSQIGVDCNDEVVVQLPQDDEVGREVIQARCDRMLRCEKIPVDECKAAVAKLETAQRAVFTTTYNATALHDVADCLSSSSCSDNEEEARTACYKPADDKLLWFPN
jgi:hypothetical protein